MRCAVVEISTYVVQNVVVAEPSDPAPDACELIGIADDEACAIGYLYDPITKTFSPPVALSDVVPDA